MSSDQASKLNEYEQKAVYCLCYSFPLLAGAVILSVFFPNLFEYRISFWCYCGAGFFSFVGWLALCRILPVREKVLPIVLGYLLLLLSWLVLAGIWILPVIFWRYF